MTTATITAPETEKVRKPKAQPVQTVPVCNTCFKRLGWHDAAYCGGESATMCKTCHQKAERKRLRGTYVSPKNMPKAPMVYGTEHIKKLTARPAWKTQQPKRTATMPQEKAPRWVRSMKRAERNLRRKTKRAA